jgi:hypothetical protein
MPMRRSGPDADRPAQHDVHLDYGTPRKSSQGSKSIVRPLNNGQSLPLKNRIADTESKSKRTGRAMQTARTSTRELTGSVVANNSVETCNNNSLISRLSDSGTKRKGRDLEHVQPNSPSKKQKTESNPRHPSNAPRSSGLVPNLIVPPGPKHARTSDIILHDLNHATPVDPATSSSRSSTVIPSADEQRASASKQPKSYIKSLSGEYLKLSSQLLTDSKRRILFSKRRSSPSNTSRDDRFGRHRFRLQGLGSRGSGATRAPDTL